MFTFRGKAGQFTYMLGLGIFVGVLVGVTGIAALAIFSMPDAWFIDSPWAIPGTGGTAEGGRWGCLYLVFLMCALATASLDVMLTARRVRDIGWPVFPVTLGIFAVRFSLPLFLLCALVFNFDASWVYNISGFRWWGLLVLATFFILWIEPGAASGKETHASQDGG